MSGSASSTVDTAKAPVILRATAAEAAGARLRVAGLSVLERAARQLDRQGKSVILATTTEVAPPRPRYWPATAEIVSVASEGAAAAVDRLAQERGAHVIAADLVRPHGRPDAPSLRVTDEPSRKGAEDAIFAELLRGDLGMVARYLNKPVSFRVTRYLLCKLPITPNQVTVGAGIIGLIGAALIAVGGQMGLLAGFFLAHVQSVLDGCDGELARVRFEQSAIGEWLDTIVDDGLNLSLAAATAVGLWRTFGSPVYLGVGLTAAAMLLTYNVIAYRELVQQGEGGEVLKIKWWFTKGADLKNVFNSGKTRGPMAILMVAGRRDFFVFAWLVLTAIGLPQLVLPYMFLVALGNFLVAVIQLVRRP